MSRALADQQSKLLQALWCERHEEAAHLLRDARAIAAHAQSERGLQAYRSNGLALAQRALQDAYPVAARLVGEETFERLARLAWRKHPPSRGDITGWGAQLPEVMESISELHGAEPYLADVARVEWLLHLAANAADSGAQPETFAKLAGEEPEGLVLELSPAAAFVRSACPVVAIIRAHESATPDLSYAAACMREGKGETALVWRQGFAPRVREAMDGEAAFIAAVKENRSLADSLAMAEGFDFGAWLTPAVQEGLLLAVVSR